MADFICSYIDAGKSFNMVTYFVKKVERMRKARQAKDLAKRPKITSNFQGSYFRGSGKLFVVASQCNQPFLLLHMGTLRLHNKLLCRIDTEFLPH